MKPAIMKRALFQSDDRSLSVNLDHLVTFRKLRNTLYPDLIHAAGICETSGASGITLHLRSDRRHVEEGDLQYWKGKTLLPLTLEMAPAEELTEFLSELRPAAVTLVPERPGELTTEGGYDVVGGQSFLKQYIETIRRFTDGVTIFVEPEESQVLASLDAGADSVELHTGKYVLLWQNSDRDGLVQELGRIEKAVATGKKAGLKVHAGHGLSYQNVIPLAEISGIGEFSIGHGILARAMLTGLKEAVQEMVRLIKRPG